MAARGVGRVSESQVIWLLFIVLIYVRHQLGGARGGGFGIDTADPCHGLKTMAPTQATTQWPACRIQTIDLSGKCTCAHTPQ